MITDTHNPYVTVALTDDVLSHLADAHGDLANLLNTPHPEGSPLYDAIKHLEYLLFEMLGSAMPLVDEWYNGKLDAQPAVPVPSAVSPFRVGDDDLVPGKLFAPASETDERDRAKHMLPGHQFLMNNAQRWEKRDVEDIQEGDTVRYYNGDVIVVTRVQRDELNGGNYITDNEGHVDTWDWGERFDVLARADQPAPVAAVPEPKRVAKPVRLNKREVVVLGMLKDTNGKLRETPYRYWYIGNRRVTPLTAQSLIEKCCITRLGNSNMYEINQTGIAALAAQR